MNDAEGERLSEPWMMSWRGEETLRTCSEILIIRIHGIPHNFATDLASFLIREVLVHLALSVSVQLLADDSHDLYSTFAIHGLFRVDKYDYWILPLPISLVV
jgi:hypothetical protein